MLEIKQSLKNFDARHFLKNYWQKKPLLIRQAYPGFQNPLSAQKLMEIAADERAEARIILEKGGKKPWELRHGPFGKRIFKQLPESHWTLLVQGTNHWITELNVLLEDFYFIPQWRIEDVMTSFAVQGGNVGAHVDNYDVFLLQAAGQREWRISHKPVLKDDFLPDYAVKLLRHFKPDKSFILNPGDLLYLPPRFAHHGIALDNQCITHSIGFRAPAATELLDDYLTHVLSLMNAETRYTDADLLLQKESGEISKKTLDKVIKLIQKPINDSEQIKRWFGQFITQNKYTLSKQIAVKVSADELLKRIKQGEYLLKNPAARFAFIKEQAKILLYINGEEYILPATLLAQVRLLTVKQAVWLKALPQALKHKKFAQLLAKFINSGYFYFK